MDRCMKLKFCLTPVMGVFIFCLFSNHAYGQFDEVNACYEKKDKECLQEIFKPIIDGPTPEINEAVYLLGRLYLEEGNYEEAKEAFEIGVAFGASEKTLAELVELLKSGKVDIDTTDCMFIGTEQCYLDVAKNKPEKAGAAYYLLAKQLSNENPERSAEYTFKAANLGHRTSACLLAAAYAKEKVKGASSMAGYAPALPLDYEQSRYWSKKCGNGPFAGYSEKHFKRYQAADGHRAYAKFGSRYRTFSSGAATPELAKSLAGAICKSGTKDKKEDEECLVVNVDGEWVDYSVATPMPSHLRGVDSLVTKSARTYFNGKYTKAIGVKVLVQGPLGNWSGWIGGTNSSLEELTQKSLARCHENWRHTKHGSACEVVNYNGVWVK